MTRAFAGGGGGGGGGRGGSWPSSDSHFRPHQHPSCIRQDRFITRGATHTSRRSRVRWRPDTPTGAWTGPLCPGRAELRPVPRPSRSPPPHRSSVLTGRPFSPPARPTGPPARAADFCASPLTGPLPPDPAMPLGRLNGSDRLGLQDGSDIRVCRPCRCAARPPPGSPGRRFVGATEDHGVRAGQPDSGIHLPVPVGRCRHAAR